MAALNDIYQVKVYSTLGQQGGINVLHAKCTFIGGAGVTDQQIADGYSNQLHALWKALMSSTASFRGIGARKIIPTLGVEAFSILNQGAGGVVGDPLPKQVSGIVTWRTALPGRQNRGRSYIPFPGESSNDADQTPVAGYVTALGNLINGLVGSLTIAIGADSNAFTTGVYHRAGQTINLITSGTARDRWATQRRRGDYGRTNILPI
jgi:hypothetical protein